MKQGLIRTSLNCQNDPNRSSNLKAWNPKSLILRMEYFFILGRNPALSTAEISSLVGSGRFFRDDFSIAEVFREVLFAEGKKENAEDLLDSLGGTVKIGGISGHFKSLDEAMDFTALSAVSMADSGRKFKFGFSCYEAGGGAGKCGKILKKAGMEAKRSLLKKGISSRFVAAKKRDLSSVIVRKNGLLPEKGGAEICIFCGERAFRVGRTLAVQKFRDYGLRDFGRPGRDAHSGMLPPKLAKIMVNLAQASEGKTILDPFCGSGTVLQEAALLGYHNLIGMDNSAKAIEDTKRNMEWLTSSSKLKVESLPAGEAGSKFKVKIRKCDAREISRIIDKDSVDAIITEPYLGPPLRGGEPKDRIEEISGELSRLYVEALEEFKKVLKPGGKIVMVWPVFMEYGTRNVGQNARRRRKKEMIFLPILDEVLKMGYGIKNSIPKKLRRSPAMKITNRGSIVYSRPGQRVAREIFIFKYSRKQNR